MLQHARSIAIAALAAIFAVAVPAVAQGNRPVSADPFAAIARQPVVELDLATPPEDGKSVVLRVFDQQENPIAGADVMVLEASAMLTDAAREIVARFQTAMIDGGFEARFAGVAAELGTRYRTNDEGLVRVAWERSAQAFVVHRRDIGVVLLREEDRPLDIRVQVTPKLEVQVVDARGRPAANVLVKIAEVHDEPWRALTAVLVADRSARTDAEGRALLPLPDPDGPRVEAVACIVSRSLPRMPLAPGAQRARLELPPCGRVRVYFEDLPRPVSAVRSAISLRTNVGGFAIPIHPDDVGPDFATFAWVGLGESIRLDARAEDFGVDDMPIESPRMAGEMKVVTVAAQPLTMPLRLRVLDPAGEPVDRVDLGVFVREPGRILGRGHRSDTDGTLEFDIDRDFDTEVGEVVVLARRVDGSSIGFGIAPLRAAVEAGRSDGAEPTEIRLRPEPLLIAGRVVDSDGAPVAGVTVWASVDQQLPSVDGGVRSTSGQLARIYQRSETVTDEQGRFELREPSEHRASVSPGIESERGLVLIEDGAFPPGSDDVELRVDATVEWTIPIGALPAGAERAPPIRLQRRDAQQPQPLTPELHRGEVDALRFKGVTPGSYDLIFEDPGGRRPIATIEEIRVTAAGTGPDPRLAELDWSEHYRWIRVRPLGPDGDPLAGVQLQTKVEFAPRFLFPRRVLTDEQADGSLGAWIASRDKPALEVIHPRMRTVRLTEVDGDREVRMEPRPALRVRLADGVALPDGITLIAKARAVGGADDTPQGLGALVVLMGSFGNSPDTVGLTPITLWPDLPPGAVTVELEAQLDRELRQRLQQIGGRFELMFRREAEARLETDPAGLAELRFEPTEGEREQLREAERELAKLRDR